MCWVTRYLKKPYLHLLLEQFQRIWISLFKGLKYSKIDSDEEGCQMI